MNCSNKEGRDTLDLDAGENILAHACWGRALPSRKRHSGLVISVSRRSSPSSEKPGAHTLLASPQGTDQQVEMDVAPGLVSSGPDCVQVTGQSWRRS